MGRTADANFITEKNKEENRPRYLYEIVNYDGASNDLRYTAHSSNYTFDSKVYEAFPLEHDNISENSQDQIDIVNFTLSNISRVIQANLETYDWRAKQVNITVIFVDYLNDPDVYLQDTFYIDAYRANTQLVSVTLASLNDVLDDILPGRRFTRNFCQVKVFGNADCGYTGGESECDRTPQRCRALNNITRIGAELSIPSRRTVII